MSKITFRADDDLITRLESHEGSKSEIMRQALRSYLDGQDDSTPAREPVDERSLDEVISGRVDALVEQRLQQQRQQAHPQPGNDQQGREVNVNVTVEREERVRNHEERANRTDRRGESHHRARKLPPASQSQLCRQCGEPVTPEHVFCPNCGEKSSRRGFCACGGEIQTDWAYCPGCGRATPSADVLDQW